MPRVLVLFAHPAYETSRINRKLLEAIHDLEGRDDPRSLRGLPRLPDGRRCRLGLEAYYGDATGLELLTAAGAAKARVLVLAVDDFSVTERLIEVAGQHFPHPRSTSSTATSIWRGTTRRCATRERVARPPPWRGRTRRTDQTGSRPCSAFCVRPL